MQRKNGRIVVGSFDELVAMLSSPDHLDRAESARLLVNMRKEAVKALPALLALHNDPCDLVRIQVPRAIIHMEARPDEVAEVLNRLLDDEDEIVRLYAEEAQRVLAQRTSEPPLCDSPRLEVRRPESH